MKKLLKLLCSKKLSVVLFIAFSILNLYYFTQNFFAIFLNKQCNGDENYHLNLYSFSDVSLKKVFFTPSQPYIFLSSLIYSIINSPKMAVRLVSLISCFFLLFYFIKKIKTNSDTEKDSFLEKTYKISFLVCAIFITNQMFVGTSDFLSVVFLVFAFYFILNSIEFRNMKLSNNKSIVVGVLLALAVATRPTAIVLIISFSISLLIFLGFKNIFIKQNFIVGFTGFLVFILINILPLKDQGIVILDVKEVPKETGVNWFQRNYLMAKFWDNKTLPTTKWISTQDVINYKKENPDFVFPKNQFDLLIKEPKLYFRQMLRMFITAMYSSYRYMYFLFPLMFLSFFKVQNRYIFGVLPSSLLQNKIIVLTYLIGIICFSFIAVKLFEFRWIIPIMLLYVLFSLNYLMNFSEKKRFIIYNISFLSGVLLYVIFFIRN